MSKRFGLCAATVALAAFVFHSGAFAAVIAADNASNAPYASSWPNGSNGGTGWGGGWILSAAGGSFGGHFIGNSAGNGSGTSGNINTAGAKSWGMYANTTNITDAVRPFSGSLSVGQMFLVDIDNGFIDSSGSPSPTVGFGLRNSSNLNRLEFYFKGGDSFYTYSDSTGPHSSGIGFTANGLHAEFTLTGIDTYQLKVTPAGGSTSTFSGTLADGAGTGIDRVRLFNANAGMGGSNNAFFNSIAITPEPASLGLLAICGLAAVRRRRG